MVSKQRHILIDGLNLRRGGGVVVMTRLARAFATSNYKVTVILANELPDARLKHTNIRTIVRANVCGVFRVLIFRYFKLKYLTRELTVDALVSFNYYSSVTIPQATYHINVIPFLSFRKRLAAVGLMRAIVQPLLARAALRWSKLNLFESKYVQDLAMSSVRKINSPGVAYTGTELPSELPSELSEYHPRQFVTVTSGARHKRNDLTVAFFRQMRESDLGVQLVFVGDEESIRASLSNADLDFIDTCEDVVFTGYIDRKALFELLAGARALVTFSELESFFMVAIEAMSVGCPVLAADNSSIRESIGDAGLLFSPGDPQDAATRAKELDIPEVIEQLSSTGRVWAARFNADHCSEAFVRYFEKGIWEVKPKLVKEHIS